MPSFTPPPKYAHAKWTKNSLRLNNHSFSGLSYWPGMYVRGAVTAEIPLARYVRTWCSHCRDPIGQVCTYVVQSLQRSHWPGMYVRGAVTAEIPLARYVRTWCSHCRDPIGQVCTYVVQSLQRSHWPGMYVRGAVTAEIPLARYVRTWCSRAALGFQTLTLIIRIVVILLLVCISGNIAFHSTVMCVLDHILFHSIPL